MIGISYFWNNKIKIEREREKSCCTDCTCTGGIDGKRQRVVAKSTNLYQTQFVCVLIAICLLQVYPFWPFLYLLFSHCFVPTAHSTQPNAQFFPNHAFAFDDNISILRAVKIGHCHLKIHSKAAISALLCIF